jgi:pilus assembly protein CpaF
MTNPNQPTPEDPDQPIRPVGSGLASSPEAQAIAAAQGLSLQDGAQPVPVPVPVPLGAVPVAAPEITPIVAPEVEALQAPAAQPAPETVPAATAPVAAQPVGQNDGQYSVAGALSAEDVISGDPQRFAQWDQKMEDLIARVQQRLVDNALVEQIEQARFDKVARKSITEQIDRIALELFMSSRFGTAGDSRAIVATVVNEIIGLGPIEPLWTDPTITEVIVNGPGEVFVERAGRLIKAHGVRFRSQEHLLTICQRILSPLNRKLDVKDPLADGRLPDGSRVNAVHYAVAPRGPLLTIRRFPQVNRSLVDLVNSGAMTQDMAIMLSWLIMNKATSLVCGGTGTGKTTLLNALSAAIPHDERVITIEDSLELRLNSQNHVAAMEARPSDASGQNSVTIRSLVKNALRMRPDRIIVGEIRDQAALDMLQACNTGHEGSMSTVHANGPNEAISRLAVMVAQGGEIPGDKVDWLVGSALDLIIMIRRYKDGSRRVAGIYEVPEVDNLAPGERLLTIPLWEWKRTGEDESGMLIGEYVEVNPPSEHLRAKLSLDFEPKPTWEELKHMVGAA